MDVSIELLRKAGRKAVAGRTYREGDLDCGLRHRAADAEGDAWHVPVTVLSEYTAMADVKKFLVERCPDMDPNNWSLRYLPDGGAEAGWAGGGRRLSADEMRSLGKTHADSYFAVDVAKSWIFGCGRDEWPAAWTGRDVRLSAGTVSGLFKKVREGIAAMPEDELSERIELLSDGCNVDHVGRLACMADMAYRLARKSGLAAFISGC